MIGLLLSAAPGAPVGDAVRLHGVSRHITCLERSNGEQACWGLELDRATVPPGPMGPMPACVAEEGMLVCGDARYDWPTAIEQVDGSCILGEGRVFCVGDAWRRWAGVPPGTPVDQPIEVEVLAGAEHLYSEGRCMLTEGRYGCMNAGVFSFRKGPEGIVQISGSYVIDDQGALWKGQKKVLDGPIQAVSVQFGSAILVRRADGTVAFGKNGPSELVEIDLPPSPGGSETLFVGLDRSCAISEGRVACWGSDRVNQLGDGGGPSLTWGPRVRIPEVFDSEFTPMRCGLRRGVVECHGDAPWGRLLPGPPIRIEGVVELQLSDVLGCARKDNGDLHCFGVLGPSLVLPEEPLARDVVAVQVGRGIGALDSQGRLHHWDGWKNTIKIHGPLPGATDLVSNGQVSCAIAPDALLCADHRGEIGVAPPEGEIETRGTDICVVGEDRCLELRAFLFDITTSIEPHWVEAAW